MGDDSQLKEIEYIFIKIVEKNFPHLEKEYIAQENIRVLQHLKETG